MSISASDKGMRPGVCTSTTRPANPFDGMMIYETDTNLVRIWNGTAWKTLSYSDYTSGSVIQVVSTTKTDAYSLATTNTWTAITGFEVTITPTSASSKVLITASISYGGTTNIYGAARLVRGATAIALGDTVGSRVRVTATLSSDNDSNSGSAKLLSSSIEFLDSPATTSATTYRIEAFVDGVVSGTLGINRTGGDGNNSWEFRGVSTITAKEIAG
jgi:hypothetical protein